MNTEILQEELPGDGSPYIFFIYNFFICDLLDLLDALTD